MRTQFSKFAFTAALVLAITFTFSCSGGDNDGGGDPNNGGTSSPSSGAAGNNKCTDAASCKQKQIGNRVWMAENLNINVAGSECYEKKDANCDKYGRLYTWAAAMGIDAKYNEPSWGESDARHKGICPNGWHIPSNDDWEELENYVESSNGCSGCAARYLKSTSEWYNNGNGNDKYGFSALPGGFGLSVGYFYNVGNGGYWWSASEYDSLIAYHRGMGYYDDYVYYNNYYKARLLSVRCVQD